MLIVKQAVIGAAMAAAVVLASNGFRPKGAVARMSQDLAFDEKSFPTPEEPEKPTWVGWKAVADPHARPEDKAYLSQMAKILSQMDFEPEGRVGYFRELDTPEYRLDGWIGVVESTSPTPDGTVINVRVTPRVASSFGASVTILGGMIESYEVTDEGVHYLGTMAPKGGSLHGVITD